MAADLPPLERWAHTLSAPGDRGSLVAFGGYGRPSSGGRCSRLGTASTLRPGGEWTDAGAGAGSDAARPRVYHSAVLLGRRAVVFGGRAGPGRAYGDTVELVEGDGGVWVPRALATSGDAPCPRWRHAAAVGADGCMLVMGGRDAARSLPLGTVHALRGGRWEAVACGGDVPPPAHSLAAVEGRAGEVLVFPGRGEAAAGAGVRALCTRTWRWRVAAAGSRPDGSPGVMDTRCAVRVGARALLLAQSCAGATELAWDVDADAWAGHRVLCGAPSGVSMVNHAAAACARGVASTGGGGAWFGSYFGDSCLFTAAAGAPRER